MRLSLLALAGALMCLVCPTPAPVKADGVGKGFVNPWVSVDPLSNISKDSYIDSNGIHFHRVIIWGDYGGNSMWGTFFFGLVFNESTSNWDTTNNALTTTVNNQSGSFSLVYYIPITSSWGQAITNDPTGTPEVAVELYGQHLAPNATMYNSGVVWINNP